MRINPLKLMELKSRYQDFKTEHPDMPVFGKALKKNALEVGTVLTIRAETPEGKVIKNSVTLTENDVEIIRLFVSD